jgi:phosphopantetheine adenylyltransferase
MEVKGVFTVGIDLGKKSKYVAVVVDDLAREIGKPYKFNTSAEGIESLIDYLKSIAPGENSFRFIMEPTPTWRLIGTYLIGLGYEICLVSQSETHDLRKALDRHKKTDRLDALTLARLPFVMPERIHAAAIPPDDKWDALYRGVKKEHKTAGKIVETKQAILELAEESIPGVTNVFPDPSEPLANLVYSEYLNPRKIVSLSLSIT